MVKLGGGKSANQGEDKDNEKYGPVTLSAVKEVETDRYILNLPVDLIRQLEKHIFEMKQNDVMLPDTKTGKDKLINRSTWAREVFTKVLNGKFDI
ncbi:hypothetical protein ACQKJG_17915 [Priestia megaterium]|uniref:hypothetical protein n=1 Tax=Priestia megaterium TaxID=1404 RepID=UPI003D00B5B8